VRFVPERVSLDLAATGTVDIEIQAAQDLASFELELRFDPAVVAVERVERIIGTDAEPTPGRAWLSLPGDAGSNATYIEYGPGHIAFGGYSFGEANPAGANGDLTLVRVHLRGASVGGSALTVDQALVTDRNALPTTPTTSDGFVTVGTAAYSLFLPYIMDAEPVRSAP
jgi:hypothetical protein